MNQHRALVLLLSAVLVASTTLPRTGAAQTRQFAGETTVVAVEIPVQVLADGQPVRGLTKESFEVLEGRKAVEIVDFEVVDLTTAQTPSGRAVSLTPPPPPAGRRHFLLLFDLTNSAPQAVTRAREAAQDLVANELHPSDLVAVATWSYTRGPRLVLGFTSDRRQLGLAISSLGLVELRNVAPDPLGLVLAGIDSETQSSLPTTGEEDSRGPMKQAFVEQIEELAAVERTAVRQTRTRELESLTAGFAQLANLMSTIDGRKFVVLLSQGFDSSLVTGSADADVQASAAAASASGEIWNVNSEERFGNTRAANVLEQMLGEFRRSDCAIHAVDIGGLAAANDQGYRKPSGRDTMLTMAKDTGGEFYENFNDLTGAMDRMLVTTSVTYVLTIEPKNLKLDGKYHELKVRLRDGRSGARLVHRPGYYAPKPYAQRAAIERQIDTASLIVSGRPGGDLEASVVAAAFRGDGARRHVPVVVEIDGPLLLGAKQDAAIPLGVYVYAFDTGGTVRDFVAQTLQLDVQQIGARLAREPLKFVADLRLPSGSYNLRTLVRAGDQGSYWLGEERLEVPTFAPVELVAVAPLAPEPMTSGIVVRASSSAERTKGLPFPFVLGQDFFLPSARVSAAKSHPARFCLNVYGLAPGDAAIEGRLVDASGRAVANAQVRVVSRAASDQPGLSRFELEIDPGSAAAGDYTLEVSVVQQGKSSSAAASLRVGA